MRVNVDQKIEEQLDSQDPRERAEAIKALAYSGQQENMAILKDIHEFDPDPKIREYARRAALHLFHNLKETEDQSPQPAPQESSIPQKGELTSVTLDTTPRKKEKEAVSRPDREKADKLIQRAFTLYSTNQEKKAVKFFVKALAINPGLEKQTFAGNLAMELTGLPLETAFASLHGPKAKKELLESAVEPDVEKKRKPIRPLSVFALILALTALGVVIWRFVL
jgi:tetratricopeptide (TPR) repeat protein